MFGSKEFSYACKEVSFARQHMRAQHQRGKHCRYNKQYQIQQIAVLRSARRYNTEQAHDKVEKCRQYEYCKHCHHNERCRSQLVQNVCKRAAFKRIHCRTVFFVKQLYDVAYQFPTVNVILRCVRVGFG